MSRKCMRHRRHAGRVMLPSWIVVAMALLLGTGVQGCASDETSRTAAPSVTDVNGTTPPGTPNEPASDGPVTVDEGACIVEGDTCETDDACCTRTCVASYGGVQRCVTAGSCRAAGEMCERATDCCTLACVEGACSASAEMCHPSFGTQEHLCEADVECCSHACRGRDEFFSDPDGGQPQFTIYRCTAIGEGTGCASLGELCDTDGPSRSCCSGWCTRVGVDPSGQALRRCVLRGACRATDEICAEPSECCSERCIEGRCGG